jgi:hypothetical protein
MIKIDVDLEVFGFLQKHARPFVDAPNDVLRRLLLKRSSEELMVLELPEVRPRPASRPISVNVFVSEFLVSQFGSGFAKRRPYRMMFESQDAIVYFQNFNKESDHLWYRINDKPWMELSTSPKASWVVLTNPVERFGFVLPVDDLKEQIQRANWSRPDLEINIDPSTSRWSELDWNLAKYRKTV